MIDDVVYILGGGPRGEWADTDPLFSDYGYVIEYVPEPRLATPIGILILALLAGYGIRIQKKHSAELIAAGDWT